MEKTTSGTQEDKGRAQADEGQAQHSERPALPRTKRGGATDLILCCSLGTEDIKMVVYDGTRSGLYDNIWLPRFLLQMVDTHLRAEDGSKYMNDMNIGKMCFYFILQESMQALFFGGLDEAGTLQSSFGSYG
jgi:hypothetical protein